MRQYLLGLVLGAVTLSGPALAGRCEYNPMLNTIQCCDKGEQAIWHPQLNRLECRVSTSLQSCLYNPQINTIQCCQPTEQAVWHDLLNRVACCDPEAARGDECQF